MTMIEHIAQALYQRSPETKLSPHVRQDLTTSMVIPRIWAEASEGGRQRCLEDARTMLTAISDPSDTMVEAAGDYVAQSDRIKVDAIWTVMVDAALAEGSYLDYRT